MNKGEQLGILLDKADILHRQMNQIFLKQGLTTPDLSLLSPVDREEWNRLYEQSKNVSDEICKLITDNNKEMNQMSIGAFKYWLRIHGFHLNQFGTGEKWNPIKVKSKKSKQ